MDAATRPRAAAGGGGVGAAAAAGIGRLGGGGTFTGPAGFLETLLASEGAPSRGSPDDGGAA